MATFGHEEQEESDYPYDYGHILLGSWFTCPEKGVADSITAYFKLSWFRNYKFVIYRKSDGVKVAETVEGDGDGEYGWKTLVFDEPKPTLNAEDYWLMIITTDNVLYFKFIIETDKGCDAMVVTYPTAPDPISPSLASTKHSIFCTYTPTPPSNPLVSKPLICPIIAAKPLIR